MKQFRSKNLARTGLVVLAAGALVFVTYGGQAYARDGQTDAGQSTTTTTRISGEKTEVEAKTTVSGDQATTESETETKTQSTTNDRVERMQQELKAKREQAKGKLDAVKLKTCEARQKGITERMSTMVTVATKHLNVFSDIATRVETFYTNKGVTVANYDALVADVNAKKAAAETAIAATQASGTSFSCTDANPSLAGQQFKDAHGGVVKALQDYRTAIKNLIVAVKSAQSDSRSSSTETKASDTTSTNAQATGSNQ